MAACESVIFSVSSVNEEARHPYSTRDCLILLIFQSKTVWGRLGWFASASGVTNFTSGGKKCGLSSTRRYELRNCFLVSLRGACRPEGGGGRGEGVLPQEKILAKLVFKDFLCFFYYYYFFIFFLCFMYFLFLLLFYYFSCFLNFNLKSA